MSLDLRVERDPAERTEPHFRRNRERASPRADDLSDPTSTVRAAHEEEQIQGSRDEGHNARNGEVDLPRFRRHLG